MNFVLSTLALLAGPLVYGIGRHNDSVRRFLDAVVILSIGWIVGVHIIPEAIGAGGTPTFFFLALGIAFPFVLHFVFHVATRTEQLALLSLAGIALVLHAVIDGIALLPANNGHVATAVILHRLPVGMAIWWTFRPAVGRGAAATAFALIIVGTGAAYYLGAPVLEIATSRHMAWFQAFVSGSLIDLVVREVIRKVR